MELPKFIILVCCIYYTFASEHGHHNTIPIGHYETELQDLGQHVEYPETPIKVIKITKTVAVKIPVPYPVKVIEKVPYPVHVSKPYPVPVPQIIHVPHPAPAKHSSEGHHEGLNAPQYGQDNNNYQLHEGNSFEAPESHVYQPQSFSNGGTEHVVNFGASEDGNSHSGEGYSGGGGGSSYDTPVSYQGHSGGNHGNDFESKSYDQAINEYLKKFNAKGNSDE